MGEYETVIGLETHVQLKTTSKIFCSCSTKFESPPNTNICPICCGYPGALPAFNKRVLDLAIRVCLALSCRINKNICFERKNYFYPDLPKNFQISQYKLPLGEDGYLELSQAKKIRISRIHLEEDAGKLIHKEDCSLIDFNRSGVPLLEIVSYPDISSPDEAFEYLIGLKLILQYVEASDCDMEKGSLRCDANISLRKKGEKNFGTKVELKNMNTFKGVRLALQFETKRQAKLLTEKEKVVQETRLWDAQESKTLAMRTKEEACDYRYFPEPDLPDFSISPESIERQKSLIGELPAAKRKRFLRDYQMSDKVVDIFIANRRLTDFFEEVIKIYPDRRQVSNWLLGSFLEQLNALGGDFNLIKISAKNFANIVKYFSEGRINNLAAKKVLALSITTNADVDQIIKNQKLLQVSSESDLIDFIEEVIRENPKPVKEYISGKSQALQFLVGKVMHKTKGKANPKTAKEILERRIKK